MNATNVRRLAVGHLDPRMNDVTSPERKVDTPAIRRLAVQHLDPTKNENKVKHMLDPKHKWDWVAKPSGDTDYAAISGVVEDTVTGGSVIKGRGIVEYRWDWKATHDDSEKAGADVPVMITGINRPKRDGQDDDDTFVVSDGWVWLNEYQGNQAPTKDD